MSLSFSARGLRRVRSRKQNTIIFLGLRLGEMGTVLWLKKVKPLQRYAALVIDASYLLYPKLKMMDFNFNLKDITLADPQDLRLRDLNIERLVPTFVENTAHKGRPIRSLKKKNPLIPNIIISQPKDDIENINFREKIFLEFYIAKNQQKFVKAKVYQFKETPKVTRKGNEVVWTTLEEDTVAYETVRPLYPLGSMKGSQKRRTSRMLDLLKSFCETKLGSVNECTPYDLPLPEASDYEIQFFKEGEDEILHTITCVAALNFFLKEKEKNKKKNLSREGYDLRKKQKKKKINKKKILDKKMEILRERFCELDIKYKNSKDGNLRKFKKKNIFKIHPQELSQLGKICEELEKEKKKRKINIPFFLADSFGVPRCFRDLSYILNLMIMYNECYIVYWTMRAYGIIKHRSFFNGLLKRNKVSNIKKDLCLPFEDFLNECISEYEYIHEIEKIQKKIKKWVGLNEDTEIQKLKKRLSPLGWTNIPDTIQEIKKKLKKKKWAWEKKIWKKTVGKYLGINHAQGNITSMDAFASFLFSLYMGKKNICLGRSDDEQCLERHRSLMQRVPDIDLEFKTFVEEEVARVFKNFKYKINENHTPPPTSYRYRDEDINLHNSFVKMGADRSEFINFWRDDKLDGLPKDLYEDFFRDRALHSVKVIHENGKTRVITTNHPATFLMKNFQWSVHNYLRGLPIFKYIGAQVRSSVNLKSACSDDWVLSGDYENSTDFIPCSMTRAIYDVILGKIDGYVNLKKLIRHSLEDETLIYPDGEKIVMNSGQLMGGLLSFPALCLMNHCISKYLGINKKKVNGDDLLALTNKERRSEWVERSRGLGMCPNDSKSHFHPKFGTFNSQLLVKRGKMLVHLPHFAISKLYNSSLGDIMNLISGNAKYDTSLARLISGIWQENHTYMDLFRGVQLTDLEIDTLDSKFFKERWNEIVEKIGGFIGDVGGSSRFYDPDNIQEMINKNWTTEINDERFVVGNGLLSSLMTLYDQGDVEGFEYLLKNFISQKERLDNDGTNHTSTR